jgi:hypothetical protein
MTRFVDLSGRVFGKLTVVDFYGKGSRGKSIWNCLCGCGNKTTASTGHLTSGHRVSCGCGRSESNISHGMTHTRTYEIWCGMKKRCENENSSEYFRYGGKGIRVCEKWQTFEGFLDDMGIAPEGMSLDRKKSDRDYCKDNCRWADAKTQTRNRSMTRFDDEDISLIRTMSLYGVGPLKISKEFGVSKSAISHIVNGRTWTDIDGRMPV